MKDKELSDPIELAKEFIKNAPDFEKDLVIDDIDDKHKKIVSNAYTQTNLNAAFWKNFRNWSGQGDGLTPKDFFVDVIGNNKSLINTAKFFYAKIFRRLQERFYWATLRDDVELIKKIGAENILKENPVSRSPNPGKYCIVDGFEINQRWARYVYLTKRILENNLLGRSGVWVDVGPFYGGLQGLLKRYIPNSRIVLVDFHHQLCRSYIYLKTLYPDATHIFPNQVIQYTNLESLPENSILYVPVSSYELIKDSKVDLVTNFFSLGEMRRSHFRNYMTSGLFMNAKNVFLVNRFVSAPFFEKTYDSDLNVIDYLSDKRKVAYFDVFPMHHYQLIDREILNHKEFRNTSSSYFELLSKSNT